MSATPPESGAWLIIGRGAVTYTQAEAEQVLAGYAFGTKPLTWSSQVRESADRELAEPPWAPTERKRTRSGWSYRIYDCLPNCPHAFCLADLLAVSALDARADATTYLAMEAILPDLNKALAHIDVAQTFWTLPRNDLGTTPPAGSTPSWWLWRAWNLLMGLDNVGVAITYKTLHHKRPSFFPIFDNQTVTAMGGELAWQNLYDELTSQEPHFTHLVGRFAVEATKRGGVQLTRLRIHDILLWAAISGGRDALGQAGRDALG